MKVNVKRHCHASRYKIYAVRLGIRTDEATQHRHITTSIVQIYAKVFRQKEGGELVIQDLSMLILFPQCPSSIR